MTITGNIEHIEYRNTAGHEKKVVTLVPDHRQRAYLIEVIWQRAPHFLRHVGTAGGRLVFGANFNDENDGNDQREDQERKRARAGGFLITVVRTDLNCT